MRVTNFYIQQFGWLCFTSHRQRGHLERHPHLLSLAKDVKLGFCIDPTGNRTPGHRVTVHYTTAAPRQLHYIQQTEAEWYELSTGKKLLNEFVKINRAEAILLC